MIKPFDKAVIAGWSSQVARRAHNPKVARFESRPRNHYSDKMDKCKQDKKHAALLQGMYTVHD